MSTDRLEINDLADFVGAVRSFSDTGRVLYRGHRDERWKLQSGLARHQSDADAAGILKVESELISEFKLRSLPHLRSELRDEWDLLAMAQHHGLATRLLDWTENPLVGLWFAINEPAVDDVPAALHMIKLLPEDLNERSHRTPPFAVRRTQFFQPSHLNGRIVAQGGWFSVHKWNTKLLRFSTLDRVDRFKGRVETLYILPSRFSRLIADLDHLGVNTASLFPDLDGLTRHLNWKHLSLLPRSPVLEGTT